VLSRDFRPHGVAADTSDPRGSKALDTFRLSLTRGSLPPCPLWQSSSEPERQPSPTRRSSALPGKVSAGLGRERPDPDLLTWHQARWFPRLSAVPGSPSESSLP